MDNPTHGGTVLGAQPGAEVDSLRPLLRLMQQITGLESTFLTRIDWEGNRQEIVCSVNTSPDLAIPAGAAVDWSESMCRTIFLGGRDHSPDVAVEYPDSKTGRELNYRTYVSVPIVDDRDSMMGTLCGASTKPVDIPEAVLEVLRQFAVVVGHDMRLGASVTSLHRMAMTDPLTGLANRRAFEVRWEEDLGRSARHGYQVSVIICDLDHFKRLNDDHGHTAGDEALRNVASIMTRTVRDGDLVARIGGEEFAIVLVYSGLNPAVRTVERLIAELKAASFPGLPQNPTLSVGISSSSDTPRGDLFEAADRALYAAKAAGRNRYHLWRGALQGGSSSDR